MRKGVLALMLVMLLYPTASTYGFATMGQDCSKCHTLKKEEAEALIKEIIPNPSVTAINQSAAPAVWEVAVEAGGQKGIIYIDYSKKHLFLGSLIDIKEKRNITQERFAELNKVDPAAIPLGDALVMGDKDATHKIIVFSDPD